MSSPRPGQTKRRVVRHSPPLPLSPSLAASPLVARIINPLMKPLRLVLACLLSALSVPALVASLKSVYQHRPADPAAVYLTPADFPVTGDGKANDAPGLQAAIDRVAASGYAGVLFIPPGTYRLEETVYVWSGVRLIGYGPKRPVFLLAEDTPGFQDEDDAYLLHFAGNRQPPEPGERPRDANPGTFYGALSNINFEIKPGNPAAIAVRFRVAQHSFISHCHFDLGEARAGLRDIGNEVENLTFTGGDYGIMTRRSSPGWPILVIDCRFDGQRVAAIQTREAGLTVVRPHITNTPTAITMTPGIPDQLSVSDGLLENISGPAISISQENKARTQVHLENIGCINVPTLARFKESGRTISVPDHRYRVNEWTHGLHLDGNGRSIKTTSSLAPLSRNPSPLETDIPKLPPTHTWTNVHDLGIIGDGETDVTRALQQAIVHHRVLYFPIGVYRVSDTLKLQPDTVLLGFTPGSTAVYLPQESPAFQDASQPKAVIEAPAGGTNILHSIGVYAAPFNPAAGAIVWRAGPRSLLNDVRLHGGHGTYLPGDLNDNRGKDHRDQWDTLPPSLWVTDGGGGILKNIWTPSPYAKAGLKISNTHTRGRLYAMSSEHHVSHEVILENVANWRFFALQFEAEREESPRCLPLRIADSRDLLFANTFFYRVVSSFVPSPDAIRVETSQGIRLRNTHVYSNSKVSYDNSIFLADSATALRDSEVGVVNIPLQDLPNRPARPPAEKIADGFLNISGLGAAPNGDVYFADPRKLTVHRWSVADQEIIEVLRLDDRPEQLAFDRSGNLLIVAYEGAGTVLAFDPPTGITPLPAQPSQARPGSTPILPVNLWTGTSSFLQQTTTPKPFHYVSPDGTVFIPASREFREGATRWGTKLSDLLRAFAVAPAPPSQRFYVTNEMELTTWSFAVEPDGTLSDPQLFVNEGGEAVAVDQHGRVYIAAGEIMVFDADGARLGEITVAQRPTSLAFGGADGNTLFIGARSALYQWKIGDL
jgi:sugar lactone lactonase YvrE